MRSARPARMSLGGMLQRLLERGAGCNVWALFGGAVLAWAMALFVSAWLLGVFP